MHYIHSVNSIHCKSIFLIFYGIFTKYTLRLKMTAKYLSWIIFDANLFLYFNKLGLIHQLCNLHVRECVCIYIYVCIHTPHKRH